MIGAIGITLAVLAVILIAAAKLMAAQDTGVTLDTNVVYQGCGDPEIVVMTAYEGMTPGDNVAMTGTNRVYKCTAALKDYFGTVDKHNRALLDDNDPMTHDIATGELVDVITGHCLVLKVADTNGVTAGKVVKIGTGDGVECEDIGTSTVERAIGRAWHTATSGNQFPMMQWGT